MRARLDDLVVGRGDTVQGGCVLPGHDLGDPLQGVLPVARIDTLRGIAEREVDADPKAGDPLQDRPADVLGHTRVHRGLIDHDRPGRQRLANGLGRPYDRGQVGSIVLVHGRWHSHHEERAPAQALRIGRHLQGCAGQDRCFDLTCPVVTTA